MATIQRITTQYDPLEDRMRLLVSLDNEDKASLWLTQRILGRVIGHMLDWLDSQLPVVSDDQQKQERLQDTLQGFAQEKALGSMDKSEAVTVDEDSHRNLLVSTLDVRKTARAFTLVFRDSETEDILLPLTALQLRQWLLVVHHHWQAAAWPAEVWPEWIRKAGKLSRPGSRLAVH